MVSRRGSLFENMAWVWALIRGRALLKGWTFIRGNTVVTNARLPATVQEVSPCSFSEQTVPSHEDRGVAVGIRKKLRKLSRISHAMLLQTKPSGEEKGGSREEKGAKNFVAEK